MDYKLPIGLCLLIHSCKWYSAGILFQLYRSLSLRNSSSTKFFTQYKGCLINTICDDCKFAGKNSHRNNPCLTVLQVKHARLLKMRSFELFWGRWRQVCDFHFKHTQAFNILFDYESTTPIIQYVYMSIILESNKYECIFRHPSA